MLCPVVYSLRFDLIFLMLDPQDEFYDRRLATHLVSLYHQTQEEEEEEFLVSKTRFFFLLLCGCVLHHLGYFMLEPKNVSLHNCAIQHQTIK